MQIGLCIPMLDLECEGADGLVVELFKVLFETIWCELESITRIRICLSACFYTLPRYIRTLSCLFSVV